MRKHVSQGLFLVIWSILLSSCASLIYNVDHKTPKQPTKYPKFNQCDSLRGALNPYRTCYDVYYYDLSLSFDIRKKSIDGSVSFFFNVQFPFDTLQFDLFKNMAIDSIVMDNKQLQYKRRCNAVFVKMPATQQEGEKKQFAVYYHGKPKIAKYPPWQGGFVWKKDKNRNPWVGVACEVLGASSWWPVKDHLSDEPDSMLMTYKVPEGLKCISNGVLTDSSSINGMSSFTWKVHYPINTYNATFYIGNFENFSISYKSDSLPLALDFYVLPYNIDKAKDHFLQVPGILRFFEKRFGPYPWPKDGFKLVESPFAGMEHQSAIAYGSNYKNHYNYPFDYIILHEAAHEWWGNSVSTGDYAEVWIHESFATYSEALYVEYVNGYENYLNFLRYYAMLIKNKRPIVGPFDVNYWDYRDTDVYMKGALMLHTLRNSVRDDSLFFAIVQDFYKIHTHKIADTQSFINLVNEKTDQDYTSFFNQYLFSRVCPELEWEFFYNSEKGKNEVFYRWSNAVEGFSIPIKIKTGDRTFMIKPTNKLQRSELPFAQGIIMNVDGSYIASKRTDRF